MAALKCIIQKTQYGWQEGSPASALGFLDLQVGGHTGKAEEKDQAARNKALAAWAVAEQNRQTAADSTGGSHCPALLAATPVEPPMPPLKVPQPKPYRLSWWAYKETISVADGVKKLVFSRFSAATISDTKLYP